MFGCVRAGKFSKPAVRYQQQKSNRSSCVMLSECLATKISLSPWIDDFYFGVVLFSAMASVMYLSEFLFRICRPFCPGAADILSHPPPCKNLCSLPISSPLLPTFRRPVRSDFATTTMSRGTAGVQSHSIHCLMPRRPVSDRGVSWRGLSSHAALGKAPAV